MRCILTELDATQAQFHLIKAFVISYFTLFYYIAKKFSFIRRLIFFNGKIVAWREFA